MAVWIESGAMPWKLCAESLSEVMPVCNNRLIVSDVNHKLKP